MFFNLRRSLCVRQNEATRFVFASIGRRDLQFHILSGCLEQLLGCYVDLSHLVVASKAIPILYLELETAIDPTIQQEMSLLDYGETDRRVYDTPTKPIMAL